MSRYNAQVPLQAAAEVFGVPLTNADQRLIAAGQQPTVTVTHGFDRPLTSYFCDLGPEFEIGIYHGGFGMTREVKKWEYVEAMKKLGLVQAADAASMDVPY